MTQIRCSKCGNGIDIDDTLPRLSICCSRCGNIFQINFDDEKVPPECFSRVKEMHLCEDDEEE